MKTQNFIFFTIIIALILTACNSSGEYRINDHSALDKIYQQALKNKDENTQHLSISTEDFNHTLDEYLSKQKKVNLKAPIIQSKDYNLFEDWGIYSNDGGKEDTLFYTRIKPQLVQIGQPGNEHWVFQSIECEWQKSARLSGFDIFPITRLEYRFNTDDGIISIVDLELVVKSSGDYSTIFGFGSFGSRNGEKLTGWDQKVDKPKTLGKRILKKIRSNGIVRENGTLF